jgi:ABC-type branched-subunit amino acid transport system substrate-binding protein
MKTRVVVALLLVLALIGAACSADRSESSDDGADGGSQESTDDSTGGSGGSATFGDLDSPCGAQDPETADASSTDPAETQGVGDGTISVGTVADPGYEGRPGLNQEMFDAGQAFAEWCNEQGGINGRQIELTEYDAAITQYQQRLGEACGQEFAMVGGGAVSDNLWATTGLQCGLVDIAGFAVTPEKAGIAGPDEVVERRTMQPVPNPANEFPVGIQRILAEEHPDAIERAGMVYGDLQTTVTQKDRQVEAMEQVGYEFVQETSYAILGEANWSPFAAAIRDDEVSYLSFVGEGENMANLQNALAELGYTPEVMQVEANLYDPEYLEAAGAAADGTYVRTALWPFEDAASNPTGATQQYIDLIEARDGKIASLGAQSFSAWLLFATLANECDVEGTLTRSCILEKGSEVTGWTGGGLHAASDVGENAGPDCIVVMQAEGGEYQRYEPPTADDGEDGFNCSPDNVAQLEGDYSTSG